MRKYRQVIGDINKMILDYNPYIQILHPDKPKTNAACIIRASVIVIVCGNIYHEMPGAHCYENIQPVSNAGCNKM